MARNKMIQFSPEDVRKLKKLYLFVDSERFRHDSQFDELTAALNVPEGALVKKTGQEFVSDVLAAFRDKGITPLFGDFGRLVVEDGYWRLPDKCGCAVSALVADTPCTTQGVDDIAAMHQVQKLYDVNTWSVIHGYDEEPADFDPEDSVRGDADLGREIHRRLTEVK